MAEKAGLTGNNRAVALKLLRDVTTVLEAKNITYSLDGGTLLGVVRENRLLPWDYDLDMCIAAEDFKKIAALSWRFRLRGYWFAVCRHKVEKPPLRLDGPRVIKIRNRKWGLVAGPVRLDIFVKYRKDDYLYWMEGGRVNAVIKRMPAQFFNRLTRIGFDGKQYTIPLDYDGYLTYRYHDWRSPVKEWDHLKHDHAIVDH